jgi:hypothetical protein
MTAALRVAVQDHDVINVPERPARSLVWGSVPLA